MPAPKIYPLDEAMKAVAALRSAAELEPEQFPIQAVVGMMSDEIESLRKRGQSDEEIAQIVRRSSAIDVSAAEITRYYASAEERGHHGD